MHDEVKINCRCLKPTKTRANCLATNEIKKIYRRMNWVRLQKFFFLLNRATSKSESAEHVETWPTPGTVMSCTNCYRDINTELLNRRQFEKFQSGLEKQKIVRKILIEAEPYQNRRSYRRGYRHQSSSFLRDFALPDGTTRGWQSGTATVDLQTNFRRCGS